MNSRYANLVKAYLCDGDESSLAAIGAMRESLIQQDIPIEDVISMHEHALISLKSSVSPESFDVISKTSVCLAELIIAYSLADEKKKIIREQEQRIDRERQRLEALGQMAGGVAHEFNNLLQPIMGMAELALEDAAPESPLAHQLRLMYDCADQAAVIVSGILTTARAQAPELVCLPFAALTRKAVNFLSAIVSENINVELEITCGEEQVWCEEGELSQILLNLVRNACDAMNGSGTIRIVLQRRERKPATTAGVGAEDTLLLTVSDRGSGMPPDVAERVFQPFFTTKSPSQGTGLGLSVVMSIVHRWGGTIRLDTAPGEGTSILITLPIASAPR